MDFKTKLYLLIFLLSFTLVGNSAQANETWDIKHYPYLPALSIGKGKPLCEHMLKRATTLFKSNTPSLTLYPVISENSVDNNLSTIQWRDLSLPLQKQAHRDTKYARLDLNNDGTRQFVIRDLNNRWSNSLNSTLFIFKNSRDFYQHVYSNKNIDEALKNGVYVKDSRMMLNKIFSYQNGYYLLVEKEPDFPDEDSSFFPEISSKAIIKKLNADASLKTVCIIDFFHDSSNNTSPESMPVFEALKQVISFIGNDGYACGGSGHGLIHSRRARIITKFIKLRPWIQFSGHYRDYYIYNENMVSFLQRWGSNDPWSKREYDTYLELKELAEIEMAKYLQEKFFISTTAATKYAQHTVETMIGAHILVPVNDFDFDYPSGGVLENALDYPDYLQELLLEGNNPNTVNWFGKTPLMYAAHLNNLDAIKILLKYGADVNQVTHKPNRDHCAYSTVKRTGRTALMYAAENASPEVIKLLVDAGADITARDSDFYRVSYYLKKNPRLSYNQKDMPLSTLLSTYQFSQNPSFDCKKATTRIENAICNNQTLALYDRELSLSYTTLLKKSKNKSDLRRTQRNWIKQRRKICGGTEEHDELHRCVAQTTRARIRAFFKIYNQKF